MRISLRDPDSAEPVDVVVVDFATAEFLADLFPGAVTKQLPGMPTELAAKKKAGRPKTNRSSFDRKRDYRQAQRDRLADQLAQVNQSHFRWLQTGNNLCPENTNRSIGINGTQIRSDIDLPIYDSIYDAKPGRLDTGEEALLSYAGADDFIELLRDLSKRVIADKKEASLISPAHFEDHSLLDTSRGLANITYLHGIWFDCDGGDMAAQDFVDLFPHLRMAIYSTYSSTAASPRWRAYIPTSHAMSIDIHSLIVDQVLQVVNDAGYWSDAQLEKAKAIKSKLRHGFDPSKRCASSLFYLPSQAANSEETFFIDANDPLRAELDVPAWIERCILDLRPEPELSVEEKPARPQPPISNVSDEMQAIIDKLREEQDQQGAASREKRRQKAVDSWRGTPSGHGHVEFFRLAARLQATGMDEFGIRSTLSSEAFSSGSNGRDRKSEIHGIMRSLSKRGTLAPVRTYKRKK